jgi:hypothetical protein
MAAAAREDCCVCFHAAAAAPLRPCGHWMCGACVDRWVAQGHVSCPVCRGVLVAHPAPGTPPRGGRRVRIEYAGGGGREHVGVTLATCVGGVRVRATHPADRARASGVRVGDVYTHLNGLPVRDHAAAIAIVDRAAACKEAVECRVAPAPPRGGRLARWVWPWAWPRGVRPRRPDAVVRLVDG